MAQSPSIEQHRIRIGSLPVAYDVAGSGAPIILIHGLSGSSRWWARNVIPLARQFHVHVLDLLGFGASRGGGPFVLSEAAAYVAAWMDQVGLERANLIGHSMGGFIAADLAAGFPERVDRLVLVDAAVLPFDATHLRRPRGMVAAARRLPFSFMPVLATDAFRAGPVTLAKAARELLRTDITPKLALITQPTLVVWGEWDTIVPPAVGQQLARALPNGRLATVPRAGHNPMWDRPDEFNELVADFLRASEVSGDAGVSGPD